MRNLGLVLLVAVAMSARFAFLCDDAYIGFRYSRNLARGLGPVFNPADAAPVEGYSNLGWVLYGALFEGLLLDTTLWLPLTSACIGLVGVGLVDRWGREHLGLGARASVVAAALVGTCPAWAVWSTGGLETVPFAVAVLWWFERAVLAERASVGSLVVAGLLVMLLRIEGAGWVLAGLGLGLLRSGDPTRLRTAGLVLAGLFAAYSGWRLWTFGTLVPHTAVVKVAFGVARLDRGLRYVALFAVTFGTPVLAALAVPWVARDRAFRAIAVMGLGAAVFAVLAGGDFLPMGRMLVVGLPFLAWLLGAAVQRIDDRWGPTSAWLAGAGVLLVQLLPAFGASIAPVPLQEALHIRATDAGPMTELARWDRTAQNARGFAVRGRALAVHAVPGSSLVAPAVGAVGYWSDLTILDQHGLVTREVGERAVGPDEAPRSPGHDKYVEAAYFAPLHPTLLHSKVVRGQRGPRRMRELVESWDIPVALQGEYAPRFVELDLPDRSERHFLVLVERLGPDEDAAEAWQSFFDDTRMLAADL
ncbi:MAG: hypothetical protein R3F61_01110 [Myxococcota bacterium]